MKQQPTIDIQRELSALADNRPEKVQINNSRRKVKVGWLRNETLRKLSKLELSERKDTKFERQISSRMAALIILNGYWKIKFFYPVLWRWFYYIKQYTDYQLLPVIETGKKKVTPIPSWLVMTYLKGLNDTLATMTRKEVEASHHEPS